MVIEILAYDAGTLFGEHGHQLILKQVFQNHTIIETSLTQEPYFIQHDVDLVYVGGMSENHLMRLNETLKPHQHRLNELIDKGVYFLVFGNSLTIFGTSIDFEDHGMVETLDIFKFSTIQKYRPRINNYILGHNETHVFTAHKSQFTQSYPDETFSDFFFTIDQGFGMNRASRNEGVHYKNFYGTTCVGPFLALNPLFMKDLFYQLDSSLPLPKGFDTMVEAFHLRAEDFKSNQFIQISEIQL